MSFKRTYLDGINLVLEVEQVIGPLYLDEDEPGAIDLADADAAVDRYVKISFLEQRRQLSSIEKKDDDDAFTEFIEAAGGGGADAAHSEHEDGD